MREPLSIVADTRCHTGAGPVYHPDRGLVYWVDCPRGELFEYDPITDEYEQVLNYGGTVGGLTIQADGDLLLFCDRGRVVPWNPEAGLGDPVVEAIDGTANARFTAVISDPAGGAITGLTNSDSGGTLARLDTDGAITRMETAVDSPTGMGFTPDRAGLYLTDTNAELIYRYEYEEATGKLSNREVVVDASDVVGAPGGIAVDTDGDIWSAFWDGGRVARYTPEGIEADRIELPANKVSAVTFGGTAHDTGYATTALGPVEGSVGTREDEGAGAGALFAIDPGVSGPPVFRSRVGE